LRIINFSKLSVDEAAMKKTIAMIGTLDTKGAEYAFLKKQIENKGLKSLTLDTGVLKEPFFKPDISRGEIAAAAGENISMLVSEKNRGRAVAAMGRGVSAVLPKLYAEGRFDGVIALGGGSGTSIACAGMRTLPYGVPKVMVSTVAGRDVSSYVGVKDIIMVPSVVDISGLNKISREVFARAAGAVCGMVAVKRTDAEDKPVIAATMFGNTTPAVEHARTILERSGYEVVVFPCSGTSGKILEDLIDSGYISGVLDITTTEWADELVGGVLSAGKERLDAAAKKGVPQVVVPGCLDMVNFWKPDSVPKKFNGRKFYRHTPDITLMRTDITENEKLGKIIAEKLNRSSGPAAVFLPLKGLSMIDAPGGEFWWPQADRALFDSLKNNLREDISVREMDSNINDSDFSEVCAKTLLKMMKNLNKTG
jgi:uncharacterized protein (UPF0261 family)